MVGFFKTERESTWPEVNGQVGVGAGVGPDAYSGSVDDAAAELRRLADDLEADAGEFDPTHDHEGGVQTGLGRAVGKARERAARLDQQD